MEIRVEHALVPSRTIILDEAEKRHYWSVLEDLWGVRMSFFPGSHPMAVDKSNAHLLKNDNYVVSLKVDGVRYLLMLTMNFQNEPIALLIDRASTMYEVSVWGSRAYFEKGTLLDGELARDVQTQDSVFLAFDIIASAGERLTHLPFSERLQRIHNVLFRAWQAMSDEELEQHVIDENRILMHHSDPITRSLVPKPFAPFAQTRAIHESRLTSAFRSDGLLFTRRDAPMAVGRTNRMLKWKMHHTIDVAAFFSDQAWHIRIRKTNSDALVPIESACKRVRSVKLVTNDVLSSSTKCEFILECGISKFEDGDLELFPMRARWDKTSANIDTTVDGTLDAHASASSIDAVLDQVQSAASNSKASSSQASNNAPTKLRTRSGSTRSGNESTKRKR